MAELDEISQEVQQQDPPSKTKILYDAVSKKYDVGTFDEFSNKLKDPSKRKAFYDGVGSEYDLGTFQEFESKVSTLKKKENTLPFLGDITKNIPSVYNPQSVSRNENLPIANDYGNGDLVASDPISLTKQAKELENKTKPLYGPGEGGLIPDQKSIDISNKIKQDLKSQGIDADKLYDQVKDVPEELYSLPGFSRQELSKEQKENPQRFSRKLATGKWQLNLRSDLNNSDIPDDQKTQIWRSVLKIQNESDLGDYNTRRQGVKDLTNIINQYGGENKDKLLQDLSVDRAKTYGESFMTGFTESAKNDPNSQYLDNDELLGLQYLEDTNPEAAQGYNAALIDPKQVEGNLFAKQGLEEKKMRLKQLGANLQQSYIQEEINDLTKIKGEQGYLTPQQEQKAAALTLREEQINDELSNANIKYGTPAVYDREAAVQEILGQKIGGGEYLFNKIGESTANTVEGIKNLITYPFLNDPNSKINQLTAAGENMTAQSMSYLTEKNKALQDFEYKFSPSLQKKIDEIKNYKGAENSENDNIYRGKAVYDLLRDNPNDWAKVPIKSGRLNITPSTLFFSIGGLGAQLVPFMAMEAVTGGGVTATMGRKLLSTFISAASTSFQDEYANAVRNGEANPFSHALRVTAINSAALAGAGTPDAIRAMLGTKTAIGELVSKMTDKEIEVMMKSRPTAIKNFAKSIGKSFGESAKSGGKITSLTTTGNIANQLIDNKEIDYDRLAKEGLVTTLAFTFGGGMAGLKSKYDKINNLQSDALLKSSEQPELFIQAAQEQFKNGAINSDQFNQIKDNISKAALAAKDVKFIDNNGDPLTPKNKADLLLLKIKEYDLNNLVKGDVPEQLKQKTEEKLQTIKKSMEEVYKNKEEVPNVPKQTAEEINKEREDELLQAKQQLDKITEDKNNTLTPEQIKVEEQKYQKTVEGINKWHDAKLNELPKEEQNKESALPELTVPIEGTNNKGIPVGENVPAETTPSIKGEVTIPIKVGGEEINVKYLDEYKGKKIVEIDGNIHVYDPKAETVFNVALDDSNGEGRKIIPESNNIESAKKYIDWATETRKENTTPTTIPVQAKEIKGKDVVVDEIKPIRQLGTGANVYFETKKYRVNDDSKSGKVILNVGDANGEIPLANIKFDTPNEAVYVAKKLEEDIPTGLVSDYHNVDKIIEGLKAEYNKEKQGNLDIPKENIKLADNEKRQAEIIPQAEDKGTGNSTPIFSEKSAKEKPLNLSEKIKQIEDVTDPYDRVLHHFATNGKIHGSAIEEVFGGKDKRIRIKSSTENEKRARISLIGKEAPTINELAHSLWESDQTGKYNTEDYKDAIEKVLTEYNSKASMQKDLIERYDTDAAYQKYIDQTYGKEAIDIVNTMSEEEMNHLLQLDADKENADAVEAYIDSLSQNKKVNEELPDTKVQQSPETKIPTTEEPNKEVPKAEKGTGGNEPPKGKVIEEQQPEEPMAGITHAAIAETRKELGLPKYEGKETEPHEQLLKTAQELIKGGYDLKKIFDKVKNGDPISNVENAIMAEYKAALDTELSKNPSKENLKKANDFAEMSDVAGTLLGKGLESRKILKKLSEADNLSNFLLSRQQDKGITLSDEQIKTETKKFNEVKQVEKEFNEALAKEREINERNIAEQGLNKARAEAKKWAKKTHEERVQERKDAIDAAKKALQELKQQPKKLYSSILPPVPYADKLGVIAPHVNKFVNSLLGEGIDKFDDIINHVYSEFKDVMDELKKSDVIGLLSGKYNEKKRTQEEVSAELRLVKREAELLSQLQKARIGEENAKGEKNKTEKTRRVEELEKKIKEVRRINKERLSEEPVEDKTASDPEENVKLQKKLTKRVEELQDDLKNKRYAEPTPTRKPFVLSRKTQLLKDRIIQLEKKIKEERFNDQRSKLSKWEKAWDKFQNVAGIRRVVQTAVDASIWLRQLGSIALNPRRWDIAKKFIIGGSKAVFSQKNYDRIADSIHKQGDFKQTLEDGIRYNELNEIHPSQQNEFYPKSFIYKIPFVKSIITASQRIADASLNIARYELYQKYKKTLLKQGITRESDPEVYKDMAKVVMNSTGSGNMLGMLENRKAEKAMGALFYGARLMASNFNTLNPVYYTKLSAPVRMEAMKDLAAYTTTLITATLGLAAASGGHVSINPDDSDFLQVRVGKDIYDLTGGKAAYIRTFLRWVEAGYARATKSKYEADKALEFAGKSTVNFIRNKFSPNTSYGVNALYGKNSLGQDFDPYEIFKVYPMYADDALKAAKQDGLTSMLTVLLPNILGVGYASYYSDANMKPITETIERNTRSDEMNKEAIKNYNDKGRPINDEEFTKFIKERDGIIEKRIKDLYEGTDPQNKVLDDNKKVITKKYSEMSKEQIVSATSAIKKDATDKTKEKLFGEKPPQTSLEKRAYEKLKKEREKINK